MQRKTADEKCERLRAIEAGTLQRQCARFVQDHAAGIAAAHPEIPSDLTLLEVTRRYATRSDLQALAE
jgi:hypothetical protein